MSDATRQHVVIRFKRDVPFPRFSMRKGERWTFVVAGKWVQRLAAIQAGERFDFAGGLCLAEDVEVVYEGLPGVEFSIAAGYIQRQPAERFSPFVSGKSPVQYIQTESVRTSIQAIVVLKKTGHVFEYERPAALSSDDPRRNIGGGYKTPLCREIETALRNPELREQARQIALSKLKKPAS